MDKKTVLIIDDVKFNIRAAQDMIGDTYKIIGALSAEAGMKVLAHTKPDLILLDIIMPEVDGHQVLKTLKDSPDYRDIPVIFLTADTNYETEVAGFNEGIVDYITKPFVADVLKKRIQTQISLSEYRRQLEEKISFSSKEYAEHVSAFIKVLSDDPEYCSRIDAATADVCIRLAEPMSRILSIATDVALDPGMLSDPATVGEFIDSISDIGKKIP